MAKNFKYLLSVLFGIFIITCLPFWKALSLAGIFALGLHPFLCRWYKTKNMSIKLAVFSVTSVTMIIIVPFILGIYGLSDKIVEFSKENGNDSPIKSASISKMIEKFESTSNINIPFLDKGSQIVNKAGETISTFIFETSMDIVKGIPEFTIQFIVFALALYVFLYYGSHIREKIINLEKFSKKDIDELIVVLQKSSYQCLVVLLAVGVIQAGIVSIGAIISGFGNIFLIFLTTFIVSFIPIIGAAPIAFILAIFKFLSGEGDLAFLMIGIGCIAGTIDNILKPILIQKGIDMDAALSLISIIGSIIVFGLPGLLIGPVIGTTVAYYFKKLI